MIGELTRDHGDVRPPRKLHHGARIRQHRQLVVMRSLAEAVEGRACEQLRATHHPIEMADRHGLGLGDAVHIDVKRHQILDALVDQAPHRLAVGTRRPALDLRSGRYLVHGRIVSLEACRSRDACMDLC